METKTVSEIKGNNGSVMKKKGYMHGDEGEEERPSTVPSADFVLQ